MVAAVLIALPIVGWLVAPVVARIVNLVADPLLDESAKSKLRKLKKNLHMIAAVAELDGTRISGQSLKDWIWRFRDALHDAEDAIDGFDYRSLKAKAAKPQRHAVGGKKPRNWLHRLRPESHSIFKKRRILEKFRIFDFREDVRKLDRAIGTFEGLVQQIPGLYGAVATDGAQQRDRDGQKEIPDWRMTTSANTAASIRGRDAAAAKSKILQALRTDASPPNHRNFSVLSIIGAAGVGKTELARQAYNEADTQRHFNMTAWVCVFKSFNIRRIMIEIIESFSLRKETNTQINGSSAAIERPSDLHSLSNLNVIQRILADMLKDKRFLVVLDDVWEESPKPWDTLCASFSSARAGSKIVVTTQLEKLANMVGTEAPIKLEHVLGEKECCELFKEYAFGDHQIQNSVQHRALESKGMQIAKRFGCSPLAATMIGREMKSNLKEQQWNRILHKKLGVIDRKEGDIVSVLELCYHHLPAHLKQCYLSCALFPKNFCFQRGQLQRIWTALGFAHSSDEGEDSSGFVDDLASRSFFVISKRENHEELKIHAVLHELADLICDGEFCRLDGEFCRDDCESCRLDDGDRRLEIQAKARHLYVNPSYLVRFSEKIAKKKSLRSLVVDGTLSSDLKPEEFMESLKVVLKGTTRLRLLMLPELPGNLPGAISDLRHLRYLELPAREFKKPPNSFSRLFHLQWLNLKDGTNCRYLKMTDIKRMMNKKSKIRLMAEAIRAPSRAFRKVIVREKKSNMDKIRRIAEAFVKTISCRRSSHSRSMSSTPPERQHLLGNKRSAPPTDSDHQRSAKRSLWNQMLP